MPSNGVTSFGKICACRAFVGKAPRAMLPEAVDCRVLPSGKVMDIGLCGWLRRRRRLAWVAGRYIPDAPVSDINGEGEGGVVRIELKLHLSFTWSYKL